MQITIPLDTFIMALVAILVPTIGGWVYTINRINANQARITGILEQHEKRITNLEGLNLRGVVHVGQRS